MAVGIMTVLVVLGHAVAKDFLGASAPVTQSSTAAPSPLTTFPGIGALAMTFLGTAAPGTHSSTAAPPLSTFPGLGALGIYEADRVDDFWVVSAGFGWLAGPHSGVCRGRTVDSYPNECAFKYIAKTADGTYIAGLNIESFFKMVRFSADGASQPNSGTYLMGRRYPNSAADLLAMYAEGTAYDYTFVKGLGYQNLADDFWVVSAGFGWLAGPYSGTCRGRTVDTYPNECAFKYIAKTTDGMFIAGLNIESFFKMVRFSAGGVSQPNSGKYLLGRHFPNDAAELLAMYSAGVAYDYTFVKGLDYKNFEDH